MSTGCALHSRVVPVHDLGELRPWQREALAAWRSSGRRGIVAAATGTGKTRLALAAIQDFRGPSAKVIVVVPRINLAEQWRDVLRLQLRLGPADLGSIGGSSPKFRYSQSVVVAVINSARRQLTTIADHWHRQGNRVMLIVDECHWAGSDQSRSLFEADFDATLGLSATPERADDGFDELLVPSLGPVVFRYPLRSALDDGLLAPLQSLCIYVDLTALEQDEYRRASKRIDALRREVEARHPSLAASGALSLGSLARIAREDDDARRLKSLLAERSRGLAAAAARVSVVRDLATSDALDGRRTIIFNETIAQAESVQRVLTDAGRPSEMDHSRLTPAARAQAQRRFREGTTDILVAVRTMDEGIDVPEANLAVIVSGTLNPRQRIQRIGRVVRPAGGAAVVASILARGTTEETEVGWNDDTLLGRERVQHFRWASDAAEVVAALSHEGT